MKPDPAAKDRATALRTAAVTMIVVSVLFLLERGAETPYRLLGRYAETAWVSIGIDPGPAGSAAGLRSLMIHGPNLLICETLIGPDGKPTSTDVTVDPDAMRRVVATLQQADALGDAHRFWSEATTNPAGPTPPGKRFRVTRIDPPSCRIRAAIVRDGYHNDWVADLPLDRRALALLADLGRTLPALADPMRRLAASAPSP